jgi:hypothetical protein
VNSANDFVFQHLFFSMSRAGLAALLERTAFPRVWLGYDWSVMVLACLLCCQAEGRSYGLVNCPSAPPLRDSFILSSIHIIILSFARYIRYIVYFYKLLFCPS